MIRARFSVTCIIAVTVTTTCTAAEPGFNRDIRPILAENCFKCHGPDRAARKADLRLDRRDEALAAGAIVPGSPETSAIVERIFSDDPEMQMPPPDSLKSLSPEQKDRLRDWIAAGAQYQQHWAFIPVPSVVEVPQPADAGTWARNPIDRFVLDRLRQEGIEPAPEAPREQWLRRASLDLTGLVPALDELERFLADDSPDAYETAVDRLLASPAFGERLASGWLDAARYADTFGYQSDRDMHVWPWREWVIRAFNANLPYSDFLVWQTAGDLLPGATRDQVLATAFNRLHRQTNEGGSIEAEFRQEYVSDRVHTNGTAVLGLTLECARCHEHKYDPVSQADYYQMAAFYNNIDEHGLYSHFTETVPTPTLLLYEGDQEQRHLAILDQIKAKEAELETIRVAGEERFKAIVAASSLPGATPPEPAARFAFDDFQSAGENHAMPGKVGQAIEFGGDDPFVCTGAGAFGRATPFSFSLWVRPTEHAPRMAVLHRSRAAEDAAFRGYSLLLDSGIPVFSLIHFWPGNAISVRARQPIALNEWTHVTVTYDGSSRAAGLSIYVGGVPVALDVVRDNLTRDIVYRKEWGDYDVDTVQLNLGARFRDAGFRGGAIDELLVFDRRLSPLEAAHVGGFAMPTDDASRLAHYLLVNDEAYRAAAAQLQDLRRNENSLVGEVRQIMVMRELAERRPTYVLTRGSYQSPGEAVEPATPEGIMPLPADYPRNRLGLARWLVDESNPLVARVAANRLWINFFGRGIVATPEDFGIQGQLPSHPELLDWLARDLITGGWNIKAFCAQVVLSGTYRQSSVPRDCALYDVDPDNRLLGRGPRYRLSAEQIRDSALAASGLLVRRFGGPSVMPYQPAGLWEESGTGKTYAQSTGEGLYRRSLYTFWRRTSPPPSMLSFDATSREVCTARRERTATPLQALVLLNDPQYVEAARVLAEKLVRQHPSAINERVQAAFRQLTSRVPTERELAVLMEVYRGEHERFAAAPAEVQAYLSIGQAPHDSALDAADVAATSVVVQALFGFDEFLSKR